MVSLAIYITLKIISLKSMCVEQSLALAPTAGLLGEEISCYFCLFDKMDISKSLVDLFLISS